ncbi:MAG: TRAP transporter substrate-binding protein [Betaproteobacteria bacterium]|nr:TRAP transporter substrate-binding protein [Betaproteobacteria bacterium]
MKLSAFLLTMAASLAVSDLAHSQQPIVIRFSHVVAPDTPKGRGAEKFKELAHKYTNGRVSVEVYPSSRLYRDIEEFEALRAGWVEMLAPSLSKLGLLGVPEFQVFDLPYLFPDKQALYRVMDGDLGQGLLKKLEPKGVLGLAYWDNGFKQMSANRPLRNVDDFKGLKMRVQAGSRVLESQMRALGAKPVVLPFAEAFPALKQGTVQGTENPVSNFYAERMHQVQKHLTISDHGYLGYAVLVNRKFWEGLPGEVRAGLDRAMKEATVYERESAQKINDDALAAVRRAGTTEIDVLPPEQRAAWSKALEKVRKDSEARIGPEVMRRVREIAVQPGEKQSVVK